MTYININDTEYPARVSGSLADRAWDDRASKTITLEMTYAEAMALFVDDVPWRIVQRRVENVLDENGMPTGETTEVVETFDNSDYCLAGAVTDHRNGSVSVKMGQKTAGEMLAELREVLSRD